MSSAQRDVLIVGGGVIGLACAYYLRRQGARVAVLDRGPIGGGCSHANCGFVSPSHVLPLAEPGIIKVGLKALTRPDSPLRIRPRYDPALWAWLWQFVRRANHRDMLQSARAIAPLLVSSSALFGELIALESLQCQWTRDGLAFVYKSHEPLLAYRETDRLLAEQFDMGARLIEGDALEEFEPALRPGLAGAWCFPQDAHLRPDLLIADWKKRLTEQGVAFHEHCEFKKLLAAGEVAVTAVTSRGDFTADQFVVATGAWTPLLARQLGARIPIQPGKGYSITMARPAVCPRYPMIFPQTKVAVTPFADCYRLGSTMEFAGYDDAIRPARLSLIRRAAQEYLREPFGEPVTEEWCGWRPMTPDSVPVIDRAPQLKNVWIAAGHNMLGLSMATGTGKLVAELMGGQQPHIGPEPYRLARFAR